MNSSSYQVLTTERLKLRLPNLQDSQEVLFLRSDPEVNKYIQRSLSIELKDAEDFIKKRLEDIHTNKICYWMIDLHSDAKMIGSTCLWNFSEDGKTAELGYDLHPSFQKKGYMSEAIKAVLNFGFQTLGLHNIEAYTHKDNLASIRLLKKYNFILQKLKKDEGNKNNVVFSLDQSPITN